MKKKTDTQKGLLIGLGALLVGVGAFFLFRKKGILVDSSLVLDAPLWHPDLSLSPFLTKDPYQHSCTVTGATWGPQGRTFNGDGDFIDCGNQTALQITGDITLEAWVMFDDITAHHNLINHYSLVKDSYVFGELSGGHLFVGRRGWDTFEPHMSAQWNNRVSAGVKYHIVGVLKGEYGAGYRKLFLNGVDQGNPDTTTSYFWGNTNLRLGVHSAPDYPCWHKGLIGEVRIYNRALSLAEIQQNYLNGNI